MKAVQRADIFERLYAIGKRLTRSLDLEDVLHAILECAVREVDGDLGWISLVEDGKELVAATAYGIDLSDVPRRIGFEDGITGMVAQTGTLYYTGDVTAEQRFIRVGTDIRSEIAVPLVGVSQVIGVFNIESRRPDAWNDADLKLITALAEQAAIAIENASRFSRVDAMLRESMVSLERRVQAMRILAEVTSAINASLELDEVLATVISKVRELTGGAACQLLLRDEADGRLTIHTPFPLTDGLAEGAAVDPDEGITGWVVRHRRTLYIPDVSRDSRYRCWIADTQSEIAVPLLHGGELIGVLNVESPRTGAFDRDMVELLEMLAAHAGTAIRNAAIFTRYRSTCAQLELANYLASMGEFAADLIHWFGNKAGLIVGCAENIRAAAGDDDSIREDTDIIIRHMDEVLDMKKKILGGDAGEELTVIDPVSVVADAAAGFTPGIIRVMPPEQPLRCRAKAEAFRKVIHTILENAVEAVGDRPDGRIDASISRRDGRAAVVIRDNGPGFPRAKLARLFQPFFTTRREGQGTGMGLWLCYRALKTMDAVIEVDGDVGQGLAFTIRLELAL